MQIEAKRRVHDMIGPHHVRPDHFLDQPVAFNFRWRWVSELFGVMFQDYLAYTASACANYETVPCRFDHRIGDQVKVVDTENSLDLG